MMPTVVRPAPKAEWLALQWALYRAGGGLGF